MQYDFQKCIIPPTVSLEQT